MYVCVCVWMFITGIESTSARYLHTKLFLSFFLSFLPSSLCKILDVCLVPHSSLSFHHSLLSSSKVLGRYLTNNLRTSGFLSSIIFIWNIFEDDIFCVWCSTVAIKWNLFIWFWRDCFVVNSRNDKTNLFLQSDLEIC